MSAYSEKKKEMFKNFNDMKEHMIFKINAELVCSGIDGFFELYMRNGGVSHISSLKKGGTVEDFCYFSQDELKKFLNTKEWKTILVQIKKLLMEEVGKL